MNRDRETVWFSKRKGQTGGGGGYHGGGGPPGSVGRDQEYQRLSARRWVARPEGILCDGAMGSRELG